MTGRGGPAPRQSPWQSNTPRLRLSLFEKSCLLDCTAGYQPQNIWHNPLGCTKQPSWTLNSDSWLCRWRERNAINLVTVRFGRSVPGGRRVPAAIGSCKEAVPPKVGADVCNQGSTAVGFLAFPVHGFEPHLRTRMHHSMHNSCIDISSPWAYPAPLHLPAINIVASAKLRNSSY